MVNQKFFTLFWFWLSVLLIVSLLALGVRIILVLSSEARDFVMRYSYGVKEYNVRILSKDTKPIA